MMATSTVSGTGTPGRMLWVVLGGDVWPGSVTRRSFYYSRLHRFCAMTPAGPQGSGTGVEGLQPSRCWPGVRSSAALALRADLIRIREIPRQSSVIEGQHPWPELHPTHSSNKAVSQLAIVGIVVGHRAQVPGSHQLLPLARCRGTDPQSKHRPLPGSTKQAGNTFRPHSATYCPSGKWPASKASMVKKCAMSVRASTTSIARCRNVCGIGCRRPLSRCRPAITNPQSLSVTAGRPDQRRGFKTPASPVRPAQEVIAITDQPPPRPSDSTAHPSHTASPAARHTAASHPTIDAPHRAIHTPGG